MPNRISGYKATEPLAPVKGSTGGSAVDKAQATAGAPASAAATAATATGADTVSITSSAQTLQKLSEAVAKAPVVNSQKVSAVKQAVQNGTYKVDSGSVADKIIQFESGLK